MSMLKEFKDFVMRGNVLDLAVGLVIGAAFTAIVSALVDHVITPLLLAPALKAAKVDHIEKLAWGAVEYGSFLSAILKFFIIAFILFLIVKAVKSLEKTKAPPAAAPTPTEKLLEEIRDLLKQK